MTRFNLSLRSLRSLTGLVSGLALVSTLTACGDRTPSGEGGGSSSSSSSDSASSTQDPIPTTSDPTMPMTTAPESEGSGTGGATSDGSSTGNTGVTTGASTCMDPMEGAPIDTPCKDASGCGCASGKCFLVPILGGWCSECLGDADCTGGGCTVPNPIEGIGATCNMGEPGAGCETNNVCSDPANALCGTLLAVENIISVSTCGECITGADCTADPMLTNCAPTYDVMNFSGQYKCVADNSTANNEGCNLMDDGMGEPVGNKACMSGFCGDATVMGLLHVGVCGECNSNADCTDPAKPTCTDAMVDLDQATLVGSVCM